MLVNTPRLGIVCVLGVVIMKRETIQTIQDKVLSLVKSKVPKQAIALHFKTINLIISRDVLVRPTHDRLYLNQLF